MFQNTISLFYLFILFLLQKRSTNQATVRKWSVCIYLWLSPKFYWFCEQLVTEINRWQVAEIRKYCSSQISWKYILNRKVQQVEKKRGRKKFVFLNIDMIPGCSTQTHTHTDSHSLITTLPKWNQWPNVFFKHFFKLFPLAPISSMWLS